MPEYEFITEIVKRTGCGILLDINNLYVNSVNHGWNAHFYLQHIPTEYVHEIHLAGHTQNSVENGSILIDTHNQLVSEDVWALYSKAIQQFGTKPTLIEWDSDIPELDVLLSEAKKADTILESINAIIA